MPEHFLSTQIKISVGVIGLDHSRKDFPSIPDPIQDVLQHLSDLHNSASLSKALQPNKEAQQMRQSKLR